MKYTKSFSMLAVLTTIALQPLASSADIIALEDFDGGAFNLAGTANVFDYGAGGGTSGDVFGRVEKIAGPNGTGGPFDVMDDSVVDTSGGGAPFPADVLGLIGQNSTGIFAMNDPDAISGGALNNATWSFDITTANPITNLTVDIAAAGDFESNSFDGFIIEAQIDGGGYQTIFQGVVDESATKTYRLMDNGNAITATNDPLELYIDGVATGIYLDKSDPVTGLFDTYSSSLLNGQSGTVLDIRISWAGTPSGSEPMGFDNITVYANPGGVTPAAPIVTQNPLSASINSGSSVGFSGNAVGVPLPTYQWYRDGVPLTDGGTISGATAKNLNISSAFNADAGGYSFVVSNASGTATSSVATLTVSGFAVIIDNTNTFTGTPISVPVGFFDNQSPITSVTATSGNQGLLPDGNISASGSGSNWSLNLSPLAGTNGVAVITVVASDGSSSTNATFGLIVRPSSGVFFNEFFDYPDGNLITLGSNVWFSHSGTPAQMQVAFNQLFVSEAGNEDVNAGLIGAPHTTNSGTVLYSKYSLNCLTLPTSANGNYLSHFKDDGFNFRGRVFTSTNGAAGGTYRLGIGNSSGTDGLTAQLSTDLSPSTTYTVVTRLDLATGLCTLWVDPAAESDPSVTDTTIVTPTDLTSYAFRQSGGIGEFLVDTLVVGGSFDAVMTGAPIPIPLTIEKSGGNVVLKWSDPGFSLQAAPVVTGTYTNVTGATSPYTTPAGAGQTYYRLINP